MKRLKRGMAAAVAFAMCLTLLVPSSAFAKGAQVEVATGTTNSMVGANNQEGNGFSKLVKF